MTKDVIFRKCNYCPLRVVWACSQMFSVGRGWMVSRTSNRLSLCQVMMRTPPPPPSPHPHPRRTQAQKTHIAAWCNSDWLPAFRLLARCVCVCYMLDSLTTIYRRCKSQHGVTGCGGREGSVPLVNCMARRRPLRSQDSSALYSGRQCVLFSLSLSLALFLSFRLSAESYSRGFCLEIDKRVATINGSRVRGVA